MCNPLLENLRKFNRKERFFLLRHAIGCKYFNLSDGFCRSLEVAFGTNLPKTPYFAIDYHLDWLYAAAFLATPAARDAEKQGKTTFPMPKKPGLLTATQEDIDLLVAFPDASDETVTHLLLLEAKGVTGWTNKQLRSKAKRLEAIFGTNGDEWSHQGVAIKPRFAIISPKQPSELECSGYPRWMKDKKEGLVHISLPIESCLLQPMRCDSAKGRSGSYRNWKVKTTGSRKK